MWPPLNPSEWKNDEKGDSQHVSPDSYSVPRVRNYLRGTVISRHEGLTRIGCHVALGDGGTLRLRLPETFGRERRIHIGQQVTVKISPVAVLLGAPGVWPGNSRWNRWEGRIVLVEAGTPSVVTLKVLNERLTLKSVAPVLGLERSPRTWDPVSIVIDPEKVKLVGYQSEPDALRPRLMTQSSQAPPASRVWLKGRVEAFRHAKTDCLLSLEIGGIRVSALVSGEHALSLEWMVGKRVEIYIGPWEAWLRPEGIDGHPIACKLLY